MTRQPANLEEIVPGWRGWIPVYSLGLYTITTYGTWAYAFGVLIESIRADTGWTTSFLGSIYGAAMAMTGLSAFWAGRLLDRWGPVVPFGLHAIVASGLMYAAFDMDNRWLFGPLFATGAGLSGATGFYAMTTVVAARSRPDRPERAIALLTLVGAFCSPIYLPVTAWLVTVLDWRTVGRSLVLVGIVGAVQAAIITTRSYAHRSSPGAARSSNLGTDGADVGGDPGGDADRAAPSARSLDAIKRAIVSPAVRRALTVYFLAGAAGSTMWAYQVPILKASGLSLAAAGTFAGLRGFCQLFGRMGLTAAIERFGSTRLLQVAYSATALGSTALVASGLGWFGSIGISSVMLATVFALLAGAGLGAASPLQAIHSRLHFDPGDLGLLMGLQGAVLGLAGGLGPIAGSVLKDASGSWTATVAVLITILAMSTVLLRPPPRL